MRLPVTMTVFLAATATLCPIAPVRATDATQSPTPGPPASTAPPVVYLATADSSSTTNTQSDAVTAVFGSAQKIANLFKITAIRLGQSFDAKKPEDLCTDPNTKANVRKEDMLLVFSVGRADQSANKFLGGDGENVELNFTRVICPLPLTSEPRANQAGGSVSPYWGPSTVGSYSDFYWANPVAGVAAIAGLLTSPWINKYRLWLTVPSTILDSFKHEKTALEGAIYCATADAFIEALHDGGLIELDPTPDGIYAYRIDPINRMRVRVQGVNRCKQEQPKRPSLKDESTRQQASEKGQRAALGESVAGRRYPERFSITY